MISRNRMATCSVSETLPTGSRGIVIFSCEGSGVLKEVLNRLGIDCSRMSCVCKIS